MIRLADELILYHGSYCEVNEPDLTMCESRKDFGKGFYLTSSKNQAISFLKTSVIKAETAGVIASGQDWGVVSEYKVQLSKDLKCCIFVDATREWLHCIAAHRKRKIFTEIEDEMSKYDVIIGKIADDTTNMTLAAYIAGTFGPVGSEEADDFCIKQLLPDKLRDQLCFKTTDAIESLKFVRSEKIWIKR